VDSIDRLFGLTTFLVVIAVFVPLERLLPRHPQSVFRRNWQHDLSFWVLNRPLIFAGGALMLAAVPLVSRWLVPDAVSTRVGELPLWIGVPSAMLVSDLVFYWVHRASHTFPVMWQFHAVHHSIRDLDWLAGVRVHPLDQLVTSISGVCVQLALGFSPATLAVTSTIYLWQSNAVHSNVRIPLGPLSRVFVGPAFHHWHHSSDPIARDRNFSGQLAFLDWIFRTAYDPVDRVPSAYGIDDPVPDSYPEALLYPARRLHQMVRGRLYFCWSTPRMPRGMSRTTAMMMPPKRSW